MFPVGALDVSLGASLIRLGNAAPNGPLSLNLLVPRGLLRTFRRIARAVGVRADTGKLSLVNDQVLVADRLVAQECFEDLPRSRCIARLRQQRCARDVWCHAVVRQG